LRWLFADHTAASIQHSPMATDLVWMVIGGLALAAGLWLNDHSLLVTQMSGQHLAPGKWVLALALIVLFPIAPLTAYYKRNPSPVRYAAWRLRGTALLFIFVFGSVVGYACHHTSTSTATPFLLAVPLFAALSMHWARSMRLDRSTLLQWSGIIALILVCFASLVTLQNWDQVNKSLLDQPAQTIYLLALTASIVTAICCRMTYPQPATCNAAANCPFKHMRAALPLLPYILFFSMAIRADTLFIDGSNMHWEYFVGPIRTLRNGGWLLWDTPAQYGFLNALIPALLPIHTAIDAFYLFQAAILLLAVSIYYRALYRWLGTPWLFAAILAFATFFLSYPPLIGPSPFPSSSAARFLWCYVMLFWAVKQFLCATPSFTRYVKYGTPLWLLAVFWSAESAIYATAIFLAPVALQLLLHVLDTSARRHVLREAFQWLGIPLAALAAAVILLIAYYQLRLGHAPDFHLFFLYGSAYSGGFGEMPIHRGGAIWVYGILLCAGATGLVGVLRHRITAEGPAGAVIAAMACVWVISTYYIGRAVPNNVIAEYPILCFAALVMLRASAMGDKPHPSQFAMCLCMLTLGLLSPLWNTALPEVLAALRLTPQAMESHVDAPDTSLATLLTKAGITREDYVLYYGFTATMPHREEDGVARTYERTWLPNPVQMLEEPIAPEERALVISRFMARHPHAGYFIQKLHENDDRVPAWLTLIEQSYALKKQWSNSEYRILYFVPRDVRA
jgi:hypothetical protein